MDQDDMEMLDNQEGGNDISEEDEPRQGKVWTIHETKNAVYGHSLLNLITHQSSLWSLKSSTVFGIYKTTTRHWHSFLAPACSQFIPVSWYLALIGLDVDLNLPRSLRISTWYSKSADFKRTFEWLPILRLHIEWLVLQMGGWTDR